jgi:hypothetical protein
MPYSAYPTSGQIESFIRALGILTDEQLAALLDNLDLAGVAEAAQAAWEADTGWLPFLKDTADVARRFNPPGPNRRGLTRGGWDRIDLEAGLLSVTSVTTGYSLTDAGSALALEDDYFLWPANAAALFRPWTALEFNSYRWGQPESLRIVGAWGFSDRIPADAWQAILRHGATIAYSEIALGVSGGATRWTEADITEEYAAGIFQQHLAAWEQQWRRAVMRYRRPYL